jgi:hypothetical protein
MPDDDRPAEGWREPDRNGIVRFTIHGHQPLDFKPPERDGFERFFIAVHGDRYTTWAYRPVARG